MEQLAHRHPAGSTLRRAKQHHDMIAWGRCEVVIKIPDYKTFLRFSLPLQ